MRACWLLSILLAVSIFGWSVPPAGATDNISAATEKALRAAAARSDLAMMSALAIGAIADNPELLESVISTVANSAPNFVDSVSLRVSTAFPGYAERIAALNSDKPGREEPGEHKLLKASDDPLPLPATRAQQVQALRAQNSALKKQFARLAEEARKLGESVAENNREITQSAASATLPKAPVMSGSEFLKLSISGQINRMMLYADDGNQARWFQADNDQSSTHLAFNAEAKIDDQLSFGTVFEVKIKSNSTADVTIDQETAVLANQGFTRRKMEIFLAHEALGTLSLGQGSSASNGTAEVDLSGT